VVREVQAMKIARIGRVLALALATAAPLAPVLAEGNSGAYLAARHASFSSDFEAAADYYTRALLRDPGNLILLENALTAYVALGDMDRAVPIARRILQTGSASQIANLTLITDAAIRGDWDRIIADLDAGQTVGPLYDGLARAWAYVGLGQMGEALAAFDAVSETQGVQAFGLYHKALALAAVGDYEGADRILSGQDGAGPIRMTRRGVMTHAIILAQLDRFDEAVALIDGTWTALDAELGAFRDSLAAGVVPAFGAVSSARDGMAEISYSIAGVLSGEASDGYTLIYARTAQVLRPDHIDAIMLVAGTLENLGRYRLATEAYAAVPPDHPAFHVAELGRAEALKQAGDSEGAVAVLQELALSHPDVAIVHVTLGDTLRRLERFDEATAAYDTAISLIDEPRENHWPVFFARGITHEREDRWPQAEADFRKALELRPNQPQVLNYLGYTMVEKEINLDEALDMIERAVAAEPESGYIVDSLGWVLYRLGRYDEALVHMERAVELMPIDPVINDHLGDVYWAVGREREAEFQWHRALSFIDPDESTDADPERIRRKLDVGLDVVLAEEGAPPLHMANDGG
jgi:tetratricopeptide (TPR) repeat protein